MAYGDLLQPFNIFGGSPTATETPPTSAPPTPPSPAPTERAPLPGEQVFDFTTGKMSGATPAPAAPVPPKTATPAKSSGAILSFMDGSKFNQSTGKMVSPPTVVTPDLAKNDLANKQSALTVAQTAMAGQAANVAQNNAAANPTAAGGTPASPLTATDLTKALSPESTAEPAVNKQLSANQNKADAMFQSLTTALNQVMNGTFPLTPSQQAQINATQNSFNEAKAAQEVANANYEGQVAFAGASSGRAQSAPEIQLGLVHDAVTAGISKIAGIDSQASKAVADLQQGFMTQDYNMINSAYDRAVSYFKDKSNTIQEMSDNVRQATQDAIQKQKDDQAQQDKEQARQDAAIQFALQNNVTKPFYLVGNTAIDAKTGKAVDLATYQQMTGQQVGAPESATDFSHIQNLDLPGTAQVASIAAKYPDAGILPTDTLSEATAKLKNSAIYHKDTYIAPPAGSGGGADTVTSLAQQLVNGQLAPSELSKRSTGVGSYSSVLKAADDYSMATTGKHFDISKADRNYKFATNQNTLNTLNYLGSLTGGPDTPGNLDELQTLSNSVTRTKFPALNDTAAWSRLQTGDPTIVAYNATVTEVADQIAKILQGGGTGSGTSDAKLAQANALFQQGFSKDQVTATINAIKPLLTNRAKNIIGDNPYLSDYADQFGFTQSGASSGNVNIGGQDVPVGSIITNSKGQKGLVNADGTITPQ